jgi:hypothetical protein
MEATVPRPPRHGKDARTPVRVVRAYAAYAAYAGTTPRDAAYRRRWSTPAASPTGSGSQ